MKVSIIVPVYNVEFLLPRCLDSLVNQTLREIEIITVDDASTDNSLIVLKEYQTRYPQKIKVVASKENLRQGGARNLGLKIASGEYIGFVDSDDWVDPAMYEKLYNKANNTDSDIVDSDYFIAKGINQNIQVNKSNAYSQIGKLSIEQKKSLVINTGRMWTKIYRREIFESNKILFPEKVAYEDNEIMPLIMVYCTKLSKVNEALYYYYQTENSTTRAINSYHHFDRLITSINMINLFKERGLLDDFKAEIEYKFIKLYYINTLTGICLNSFNPPEINYMKEIQNYMKKNYPKYRKNKYFISEERLWIKLITWANDINPNFAILIDHIKKEISKYR